MVGGRGKDGKDVFEENARLGEIWCLSDGLSKVARLSLPFAPDGFYFITGELGG